ncbi:MAG TPA: hypothetical protein VFP68_03310, partial [Burkholderiaceae bacterium]|nr:hypothetical protein [Burkholderiaceae bacterium]
MSDLPDDEIFENVDALARMLTLLSPRQRERLVNGALTDRHGAQRGIRALSTQVVHLDTAQRSRLVKASIESLETWTPESLGAETRHLDETERRSLIAAAMSITDDSCKAGVMSSLASGMPSFNPLERERIMETAIGIRNEDGRATAINAIAAEHMAHLNTTQRALLVESTVRIEDAYARARALSGLARAMKHLDDTQRYRIFEEINNIADEIDAALALNGLCQAMPHLSS